MLPYYQRQKNEVQFHQSMYNSKQSPGTRPESKAELALVRGRGEVCWPGHSHLPPWAPAHGPWEPAGEAAQVPQEGGCLPELCSCCCTHGAEQVCKRATLRVLTTTPAIPPETFTLPFAFKHKASTLGCYSAQYWILPLPKIPQV